SISGSLNLRLSIFPFRRNICYLILNSIFKSIKILSADANAVSLYINEYDWIITCKTIWRIICILFTKPIKFIKTPKSWVVVSPTKCINIEIHLILPFFTVVLILINVVRWGYIVISLMLQSKWVI